MTVRAFDSIDALLAESSLEGVACILADDLSVGALESLLPKLQERPQTPPLILLSEQPDLVRVGRAMETRLLSIVDRHESESELFRRTASLIETELQTRQLREKAEIARGLLAQLSPREREVLDLVVKAKSNKEISSELHLSPRTVENHRARILRKLKADSAMHLLRITLEARGIPLP